MITMRFVPTSSGKKQLNLWLSEETVKALERLAPHFHLRGRTQVAEVIIERFLADLDTTTEIGEPAFEADEIDTKLGGELTERRGLKTSIAPQTKKLVKGGGKTK